MTQVLHTPLGQPIFVGDSAQTASLLQAGLPLHLLPQSQQAPVAGLQARPRTAPVAGKKVSAQASVQSKETWAKPRPVELPSKPVKEFRASSAKTIKPVSQPKPLKRPVSKPVKLTVEATAQLRVEVPLAAAPQFSAEEPVKTQQITEILAEAKRKAKESKERELFEAERERQEVQAKQQRLQQLEAVAEARRSESLKAETRHPMPWGANQQKSVEEQQRIKDCAQLRTEQRARRPPLPQDRVGLADILEVRREVDQPVIRKKQPTPPPVRPSIKEVDPKVQQFMQDKQRRDRLLAQETEQERQQQELERLLRLKELETLHRAKLQSYKAQRPAPKQSKVHRKRIKQILARARAKLQSSSEPKQQHRIDPEEAELDPESELSAIQPDSDHSEDALKPTHFSPPTREVQATKVDLRVVSVTPAVFVSEAARQVDERSITFQAQEQTIAVDIRVRAEEVKRKLAALQKRVIDCLEPAIPAAPSTLLKLFPEQPVVLDQQLPGMSSLDRVLKAEQPAPVTVQTEVPGVSRLPEPLNKGQAATRIQACVRAFLARRLAFRLRVRRSIALDPELRQQLDAYDQGALAVLDRAYTAPKLGFKSAETQPLESKTHKELKESKAADRSARVPVHLSVRRDEDHYSLFKVILRTGAFQPVRPDSSIREETPEYSESFETPSKSSQELSSHPIREQIFEDSQSSRRSIPEDLRATPTDRYSSPSSKALLSSEELPSMRLRPEFSDKFLHPSDSIPEDLERRSSEQSISEHLSVGKSSHRKEDFSKSRQTESISERLSGAALETSRQAPSIAESISEQLSVTDLSKSYGKPDSSRKVAESISERISEQSSRKAPSVTESISEELSAADLSKSYGKPDSSRKPADSISERFSEQSSRKAPSSVSDSISEQLSVADLSKSYGKPDSGKRLAESISEEIAEQSKASHQALSPSAASISEQFDLSRSDSKSKAPARLGDSDQSSKKDSEELSHSQLDSSRKPHSSVEESIIEESISEASDKEQSSGSTVNRPKYDSPGTLPEEVQPGDSIQEELSHAHLSTESYAKVSAREKSDNIKTVEDYSEDFESDSMAVSGRPREEVSEHISEPSEKSDAYSSDFDSASHKRFDSISQEHKLKQSIEEEDIEEELSQEEDNYEDDFESASGSHEDETLRTSSSLPRSTIGGDVEASQASDSVEWEIELPAHVQQVIPEEVAEDIQTESEEQEDEREQQADQQTAQLLQQLLTEAFILAQPAPPKQESRLEPLLPSLPPLPQKTTVALLPTAQLSSQDFTAMVAELLTQALNNKAVLKALASPVLRKEGLLEQLQSESVAAAMLDERFWENWSMQGELLESGSLTEDFPGRKPLMRTAFDVVNELLGRLRPHSRLPWEAPSKTLTPAQVRSQVESEVAAMLRFQAGPVKDTPSNLVALQKLRDEKTAKLLEQDVRAEGWGVYEAQEAAVQLQVAESLLRVLAGEAAEVLGRCA